MELLGPTVAEQLKEGAGLSEMTVIRIVDQAVEFESNSIH